MMANPDDPTKPPQPASTEQLDVQPYVMKALRRVSPEEAQALGIPRRYDSGNWICGRIGRELSSSCPKRM
jgi:hypothetical protein